MVLLVMVCQLDRKDQGVFSRMRVALQCQANLKAGVIIRLVTCATEYLLGDKGNVFGHTDPSVSSGAAWSAGGRGKLVPNAGHLQMMHKQLSSLKCHQPELLKALSRQQPYLYAQIEIGSDIQGRLLHHK